MEKVFLYFDFNDVSIDEKSHENFWFMIFYTKFWLEQNLCVLGLIK